MPDNEAVKAPTAPKVLLVEDEPALRLVATDSLVWDGEFVVIEAKNADEAVEILKSRTDIQCVFTDVRMPGQYDGLDLAHHIREHYPAIPVIVTSGNLHSRDKLKGIPFIAKPYDLETLSTAIRALIQELGPSGH